MARRGFLVSAIVAVLICAAFASAEDRRTDKDHLSIMTLNTFWMWDGVAPEDGEIDDMPPWRGKKEQAEKHMEDIAALIKAANPDIINMVEVEDLRALKTLNKKFLSGMGYEPYLVNGKDTATGQDVGILTRIDPEDGDIRKDDRKGVSGEVKKSVSKNYIAEMQVNGHKIAVIGLHFLAQPTSNARRRQREAQADAIRLMALDVKNAGYLPIVLGDFNDYDGEVKDHINSTPISKVLKTVKDMHPSTTEDDLRNVAEKLDQKERYTSWYDKNGDGKVGKPDDPPDKNEYTSIDHILLPKELFEKVVDVKILKGHDPEKVSDHFPIVVKLKLSAH